MRWLQALALWWRQRRVEAIRSRRAISQPLWQTVVRALPFLQDLNAADQAHLQLLCSLFLHDKEFSGAQGLEVTDEQAVMVAAQACLPVLYIAPRDRPLEALAWYSGFVGIVLHPGEVRARREWVDEAGVAHHGYEELSGEALDGGPLMLAWSDVREAGETAREAYNVVIHEFVHVMDMQNGVADGCPPMAPAQRQVWLEVMQGEYQAFCEAATAWERFGEMTGQPKPLLDSYGTESLPEFFAVAAEAYFVQPAGFAAQHPRLAQLFDGFFNAADAAS
jgi:MtfA peptidase